MNTTSARRSLSLALLLGLGASACVSPDPPAVSALLQAAPRSGERIWLGPNLWGNRLQDWRFNEGRIECVTPRSSELGWLPMRTAHELVRRVDARRGAFRISVGIEPLTPMGKSPQDALAGVLVGVGKGEMDPRSAAVVHHWSGNGAGILVALDPGGVLHIRDNASVADAAEVRSQPAGVALPEDMQLEVSVEPLESGRVRLSALATHGESGQTLASASRDFDAQQLAGNVALLSHPGGFQRAHVPARFGFRNLEIDGAGCVRDLSAGLGPILGSQYTVSRGILKLTAQMMPMGAADPELVFLDVWRAGRWDQLAASPMQLPGWTANFRVPNWDASRETPYRLRYALPAGDATQSQLSYHWPGRIRADPVQSEELVLAVLNCNHLNSHAIGGGWGLSKAVDRTAKNDWVEGMWFPHAEITHAVAARNPDLLFFAGDQIYNGKSPTYPDHANIQLDYLYKWYLFLWAFRELTAVTPTVTIPDDHDVYQGNLWGAGGGQAKNHEGEGGYIHPAEFVRMVERTQTSHLPDPYDPTPVEQGIGVYYTDLLWGGISFAILEDRKFKSGCKGVLPPELSPMRPDHVLDADWDPSVADDPGLELLGARQESFLNSWSTDWEGASMKAVLSQSPLACLSTHHGANLARYEADLDANGWPQAGRRRALESMRAARAVHITGDQHLAIVAQHGLDAFGDGPWSFTGPAIANFYPRAWAPSVKGDYRPIPAKEYTGDFLDGFGNRVSVMASANPDSIDRPESPADLYDNMPGFGSVIFHKQSAEVTFECWPRGVDPSAPDAWQYEGWPITVRPR